MLFGDGFEKTMKEHVEAMRCIRKSSSNSSKTTVVFSEGPPPGSVLRQWPSPRGRQQSQRPRAIPAVLSGPQRGKRELFEEEAPEQPSIKKTKTLGVELVSVEIDVPAVSILYAYANNPVISIMPQHSYPSTIINHLQTRGIVPMAQKLAERAVLPASRLTHCMENWRQITQDQWVLETVRGYCIPFVSDPRQRQLLR